MVWIRGDGFIGRGDGQQKGVYLAGSVKYRSRSLSVHHLKRLDQGPL